MILLEMLRRCGDAYVKLLCSVLVAECNWLLLSTATTAPESYALDKEQGWTGPCLVKLPLFEDDAEFGLRRISR